MQTWAAGYALINYSRVRVTLRLAVYCQSVCLGTKHLEALDQIFFFATEPLRS
jgi:hypothetical protein